MLITETGTYEMLEDLKVRLNAYAVATVPKGTQFKVTQVNSTFRKFYAPELGDWQHQDFPAKKVD